MTLAAQALIDAIAPQVQAQLLARREAIVASTPGIARREAVRLAFPSFVGEVPALTGLIAAALLDKLPTMTLVQLASLLEPEPTPS